jgi:sphingolipid delta-4 desaturase
MRKYPEIRALQGYDPKAALILIALVAAQLGLAAYFQLSGASFWLLLATAYFVGAVCNHWLGMGLHECSHDLVLRGERANRWLAIFANLPIVVPSAMSFRRYHLDHHTYLGIEGRDNDLSNRREAELIGNSAPLKALWLVFYVFFAVFARGFFNPPNRWEWTNILVQLAFNASLVALLGWTAVGYLLLSTFFGYGAHPVAGHFVHEHYLWDGNEQETYSYYGPLNAVNFNVGYHNEHHDFMGIPGSRLPELRRIASQEYGALKSHDSWVLVWWRFVRDRDITHFSRMIRGFETYAGARKIS